MTKPERVRTMPGAKRLIVLLGVLALLFTACRTNTTIDTTSTAPTDASQSTDEEPDSDDPDTDDGGTDDGGTDDADTDDADADGTDVDDDGADAPAPTATTDDTAAAPTATPQDSDAEDTDGDGAQGEDDSGTGTQDDGAESDDDDSDGGESASTFTIPSELTDEQAAAVQAVFEADDWCEAANAVDSGTDVLDTADFTDPVSLEQSFVQALAVVTAAQRLAPPEIAGDVATTVEGFGTLTASLEQVGWSFIDLELNVLDELNAPIQLASYNIQKYNFEVCGVGTDPGLPPSPDDFTAPTPGGVELDGTIRDQAVQGLVQAGFTEEQASCLLDELDINDPAAFNDTTAILNVFTQCGISLDQLGQLGG